MTALVVEVVDEVAAALVVVVVVACLAALLLATAFLTALVAVVPKPMLPKARAVIAALCSMGVLEAASGLKKRKYTAPAIKAREAMITKAGTINLLNLEVEVVGV